MNEYELKSLKEKIKRAEQVQNSIERLGQILIVSSNCKPLPVHIDVERCTETFSASLLMNQELWDKFYALLKEIQHYQRELMENTHLP